MASIAPGPRFKPSDLLALPESERRVLRLLLRQGPASVEEVAEQLKLTSESVWILLDSMKSRGIVAIKG